MATENISAFVEYHLSSIIPSISRILKDTTDFLNRINNINSVPENAFLVTFDVVGLYPHIPHQEGIAAMRHYLDKRVNKDISTDSLCRLAEIILRSNYFEFDDHIFHQTFGTAMGTKFAPPYANLFMANLEETLLAEATVKPLIWWRYLDDIFAIWTGTEEELDNFHNFMNNYHPTIKFTMEKSADKINFLDVSVYKTGTTLSTDVFCKETDTHQYLHARSCHPPAVKKSIAYGQAVRIKRIVSDPDILNERLDNLCSWLTSRGYDHHKTYSQIHRVDRVSRDQLLQPRDFRQQNNTNYMSPLILTYHPSLLKVYDILRETHKIIHNSLKLSKIFPRPPMVSFRNADNLKHHLVHSKLKKKNIFPRTIPIQAIFHVMVTDVESTTIT